MKKIICLLVALIAFGCVPATIEKSLKKVGYQKDPLNGSEFWEMSWRTPSFEFVDMFEEYEINSYLKCVKENDNYSIYMTTQSGAGLALDKYEISSDNLSAPIDLEIGELIEQIATIYKGDSATLDIYGTSLSKSDVKTLIEMATTPKTKFRAIGKNGDKFVNKKLSDTEMMQIRAILMTCKIM